jgi:homoserine dehydrogenase
MGKNQFRKRKNKTLIIGYGVVGKNLSREIQQLEPDIYDKYKIEKNTKQDIKKRAKK